MNAKIETLKTLDANGVEFYIYPNTLVECIANKEGVSLENYISNQINLAKTYADELVNGIISDAS